MVEEDTVALTPIPPRPPALLVVGLKRLRHIVVDDEPDIRLIDAHTKGARRADDPGLPGHEPVVRPLPGRCRHPGMVGERPESIGFEAIGERLRSIPCREIDDPRLTPPGL